MNIKELINEIKNDYNNSNYVEAIRKIEEYLSVKNNGVYDLILNIYINCQIQMGMLDEARKNLDLLNKLYPGYYTDFRLASKYISCGCISRLDEILDRVNSLEVKDYFHLGESCFLKGYHQKAEELFLKFLSISKDDSINKSARNFLRKIRLYRKDKSVFVERGYFNFKVMGQTLDPGHVIYVRKLNSNYKENNDSTDPKKDNRPYMVWKVIDGKIYAFNMSTQINYQKDVVLRKEDYPNNDFDVVVRNELLCIDDRDVVLVSDKLKPEDYENTIRNIYIGYCVGQNISKNTVKFFMDMITSEIKVRENNIIVVYDSSLKNSRQYFVLDVNLQEGKYKVIEVIKNNEHRLQVVGSQIERLSMKTPILKVIKLSDKKVSELQEQIPVNFTSDSMIGSIVNTWNKKLEILIEEDDYYICIDRTFGYSSSFIIVELIKKNIPLSVSEQLSQDVYQSHLYTLREYLKSNPGLVSSKKRML